jgi:hypothetical protein
MKVRTFTGSETAKVDKQVNDWLAKFGIKGRWVVELSTQHAPSSTPHPSCCSRVGSLVLHDFRNRLLRRGGLIANIGPVSLLPKPGRSFSGFSSAGFAALIRRPLRHRPV